MPETNDLPKPRIIHTRRKTVALIIEPDGSLLVRAPLQYPRQRIEKILREKADWIRTQQEQAKIRLVKYPPHQFITGETFWYLGQQYHLHLVSPGIQPLIFSDHFYLDQRFKDRAPEIFKTWYCRQARQVFSDRVANYAGQMGLKYSRLRVSSARTRWGSCSSRGTISLSWRLVMAPTPVIDYIIIHELVHLKVPNHSRTFWAQVASLFPTYREQMNWLRQHGHELKI